MGFIVRKNRPPVGAQPGDLQQSEDSLPTIVHVVVFNEQSIDEFILERPEDIATLHDRSGVVWIDVRGLADHDWLNALGEAYGLHPLSISDVAHVPQRPKYEHYDNYSLVITSMILLDGGLEQLSIVVNNSVVLTFQERYGDVFDPVRLRLREAKGSIRKLKSDYLCYALIDAVVDGYFPVIEGYGDSLEGLEEELLNNPSTTTLNELYRLRRDFLKLRRAIWPLREAINSLIRGEPKHIKKATLVYFRDVYDHLLQVIDVMESYRELSSGLMELYLSSTNKRMNEVMKTLTMIATIFIPLSFLTGIYGMNFEHMPELHWKWSYPLFWFAVIAVTAGLVGFFWKRGWIR